MPAINELRVQTMTAVVEDIKDPQQFLKNFLYSREIALPTETIRIDTVTRGRLAAPFVRRNGEALMVPGRQASGYSVDAPNIRIKKPLTPDDAMFNRQPGEGLFSSGRNRLASVFQTKLAEDLMDMESYIANTEEWLASRALQGSVSYAVTDEEVFTITYPRDSANNITLTNPWDVYYPDTPTPLADIISIKRVVSDDGSPALTDAILGSEAADAFIYMLEQLKIPAMNTQTGVTVGDGTLADNFADSGVLYLGKIGGIRFWSYSRQIELNGSMVDLIRPKYAEFVSRSTAADRVMYYGAIPDVKALRNRNYVGRRFSKSWDQEDPSAVMALVASRPLPVPRRPNASVSVKIVSG